MSSQSIVCATCSAAVPYGRLSCPACGELLASVAGAARRVPADRPPRRAARASRATPSTPAARATAATPSVLVDVAPLAGAVTMAEPPATESSGWDAPEPAVSPDDEPHWPVDRPATPFAVATAASAAPIQGGSSMPHVLQPVSAQAAAVASPPVASAAGAYVPPVVPALPAGPPAPARAWAGHPAADAATPDAGAQPGPSVGALVDAARLPEFVGWLAVAGSAMAAVGFLLPWGISVIGASGVDYFDRWGMAGPFHPIVVLALLGILGLALIRNPIPLWVRVGLPGLGLGALLLGLVWPYLLALPGTGPGVLVGAIGAIILIVAGIIALIMDRHAGEDRAV